MQEGIGDRIMLYVCQGEAQVDVRKAMEPRETLQHLFLGEGQVGEGQ
jgi:hypothetical protein